MQKFQSTLPREERLAATEKDFEPARISIHAPTRGATAVAPLYPQTGGKFQSTLPREERLYHSYGCRVGKDFNPRSHERSDRIIGLSRAAIKISIHAPTRGATWYRDALALENEIFQSTLPREERLYGYIQTTLRADFNPRSHERSDPY